MSVVDMDEPFYILDLLRLLTTPPADGPKHDVFGSMLESQLRRMRDELETNSTKYANLDIKADMFCSETEDVHWRFVGLLLRLLLLYKTKVEEVMPQYQEEVKRLDELKRTEDTAPPMSPDTLGSRHVVAVETALQFITCLGICPALLPGVGVPATERSKLIGVVWPTGLELTREVRDRRLTHCAAVLLELLNLESLRTKLSFENPGDLLAMLVQLSFAPLPRPKDEPKTDASPEKSSETSADPSSPAPARILPKSDAEVPDKILESYLVWRADDDRPLTLSDRKWARMKIRSLKGMIRKDTFVREILILQGYRSSSIGPSKVKSPQALAPPWLRKHCGYLFSEFVIQTDGVRLAISGLVTGDFKWKQGEAIARVIATCPPLLQPQELYYTSVGKQVLDILHYKGDMQCVRIAMTIITILMELHPQVAMETVMKPLMGPLLRITTNSGLEKGDKPVVVDEKQMKICIGDLHQVFVVGHAPNTSLLASLLLILQPLFKLHVFTSRGVFSVKAACADILAAYLNVASSEEAISSLRLLIFSKSEEISDASKMGILHPDVSFSAGPTGGVVAVWNENRAEDVEAEVESVAKCISELLSRVKRPEVTAELFLFLLKRLSTIIKEEVHPDENAGASTTGNSSQEMLEKMTGIEDMKDNLMVMTLLAHMTELLGPDCFTQTKQIVDFVQVTLERGVTVLKNTEDEMFGAFENETVTMAMGMLTAVMGGAKKLSPEEKNHLKELLPLLQELSEQHPDPSIQEMASDLRIAIATHGFILSDSLKSSNQKGASGSGDVRSTNEKGTSVSHDVRPTNEKKAEVSGVSSSPDKKLIEVISSSENDDNESRASSESKEKTLEQILEKMPDLKMNELEPKSKVSDETKQQTEQKQKESKEEISKYKEAINCLLDPLLPVRGHGLIMLSKLLLARDQETMQNSDMLLKVFQENIHHDDSYIYLAAINGLSELAIHSPDQVLPILAKCYCQKIKEEKLGKDVTKKKDRNVEWRLKLGETLVKTCKALGDFVPSYRDMLVSSCLTVAKDEDPLVRASAISNLGDVCRLLRFSLGNVVFQVLACVSTLLKSDPDVEVRKSAAMFTTLLLQGLGSDATKVLEEALLDLYRLLKMTLKVEKEEMVRVHVQLSLEELGSITREFLFPKQTLTKHIYVADAPPN